MPIQSVDSCRPGLPQDDAITAYDSEPTAADGTPLGLPPRRVIPIAEVASFSQGIASVTASARSAIRSHAGAGASCTAASAPVDDAVGAADDDESGRRVFLIRTRSGESLELRAASGHESNLWVFAVLTAYTRGLGSALGDEDADAADAAPVSWAEWHHGEAARHRLRLTAVTEESAATSSDSDGTPVASAAAAADATTAPGDGGAAALRPVLFPAASGSGTARRYPTVAASLPATGMLGSHGTGFAASVGRSRAGAPAPASSALASILFAEEPGTTDDESAAVVAVPEASSPAEPSFAAASRPSGLAAALSAAPRSRHASPALLGVPVASGLAAALAPRGIFPEPAAADPAATATPAASSAAVDAVADLSSAEDRRMLGVEQRLASGRPLIPQMLLKLQHWQRTKGRPVAEAPDDTSRPRMARGRSAPVVPSASRAGPGGWSAANMGEMGAGRPEEEAASAVHEEQEGEFGGKGESGRGWGVWGCVGFREQMDDQHVAVVADDPAGDSLFGVFDGHGGCAASRFAASCLPSKVLAALRGGEPGRTAEAEAAAAGPLLRKCFQDTDAAFMAAAARVRGGEDEAQVLPGHGGVRAGTTALVVAVNTASRRLVIAGVGDCRAVVARGGTGPWPASACWLGHTDGLQEGSVGDGPGEVPVMEPEHWTEDLRGVTYADLLHTHSPGSDAERARIGAVNGWVTVEEDSLLPKLKPGHRQDRLDPIVMSRLRLVTRTGIKCIKIHRVNGELGVARALGDLEFKEPLVHGTDFCWRTAPDRARRAFTGDLVSASPDVAVHRIPPDAEALVIACDGMWDVIGPMDAARAACEVLRACGSTKLAARRLAEAAIHLGSSDNVTVLVVDLRKPA